MLYTYKQLNESEQSEADKLYYLLGESIDKPIFSKHSDGSISAVCSLAMEQIYSDTWGYFCYEHRKAYSRNDANCCDGTLVYPIRKKEAAEKLLTLKTFKEQMDS